MSMHILEHSLRGGKSCSTGEAMLVANRVLAEPDLFPGLMEGLSHPVPLVRMRFAYALSKVVNQRPESLQPFKQTFLDRLTDPDNSHLARACMLQCLACLELDEEDVSLVTDMLRDFLHSDSSVVKTFSLQLLAEFAEKDTSMRGEVVSLLWNALESGTPAMRARARKLLKRYKM